jgi:hypothetical protein
MSSTKVFEHPSLGKIEGIVQEEGITTFLNVQFGSLPHGRFTQSVLREQLAPKGETYDATKPGYSNTRSD